MHDATTLSDNEDEGDNDAMIMRMNDEDDDATGMVLDNEDEGDNDARVLQSTRSTYKLKP